MRPLCTPERTWPLWIGWIGASVADAGFTLAITSVLYEAVPAAGPRRVYFVANNLITFAVGGVLTACATLLASALKDSVLVIGVWRLEQFHIHYLLCAVVLIPLGFGSAFFLPPHRVRETVAAERGIPRRT